MHKQSEGSDDPTAGAVPAERGRLRVLVVEPEALLRWSVVTYLSRWCYVLQVDSQTGADQLLDGHTVDAVIVADRLADGACSAVEEHVRSINPSARIVRTGVSETEEHSTHPTFIEKPFELSKLAEALGINPSAVS